MRQGHLVLMFFILYMGCFFIIVMEQNRYDRAISEKQQMEQALLNAMEATGKEFTAVTAASEEEKKQVFSATFLESLQLYLGVYENFTWRKEAGLYIPLLILAETDGAFFCYLQEEWNGTEATLCHVWSDKIPYERQYGDSEAEMKASIADLLERKASEYITNHNRIASQYGIIYRYFVPDFLQNTSTELNFPMLFVVFQGWPLTAAGDVFYENCMDVGAFLQKTEHYVITGPVGLSRPYCVYHRMECTALEDAECLGMAAEQEAVKVYGALPCECCIK